MPERYTTLGKILTPYAHNLLKIIKLLQFHQSSAAKYQSETRFAPVVPPCYACLG